MAKTNNDLRYGPTSGTVTGWFGLAVCAGLIVVVAIDADDIVGFRWICGLAAAGVAIWAAMLRPVIIVRPSVVELRNAFWTWQIPLASIDVVAVRAVTRIGAGGQTYDSVAVGRRVRKMIRTRPEATRFGDFGPSRAGLVLPDPKNKRIGASTPEGLADLMTERILSLASDARNSGQPAGPAVRVWAVPELVAFGLTLLALTVTSLV